MDVREWLRDTTPEEREKVAQAAGTKVSYLWQIAGGHSTPRAELAKALVIASESITPDRPMQKHRLRPDLWEPTEAA